MNEINITKSQHGDIHRGRSSDFRFPFQNNPAHIILEKRKEFFEKHKLPVPYFIPHVGVNNNQTFIAGKKYINFSSYNYLALSGHPEVTRASKQAIDSYGTSVSASRVVSGEIPLHGELEEKLARFIGVEASILYVGGHATNVSTIGHLFGVKDLIIHDEQIHNSAREGCKLSGSKRMAFRHNDITHLNHLLNLHRDRYEKVLIIAEGVYSMEGDIANLPAIIEIKKRYSALLMVDEAHSLGVLGKHGRGIGEHFNIDRNDVDLWMGTLSKALASCGGYIAGSRQLIDYLKFTSPGFVYSVGLSPSNAAAAIAALDIMQSQSNLVDQLRERSKKFLEYARIHGLDTGLSNGTPVIPVIIGDSIKTVLLAQALFENGISVAPIFYPVVKQKDARLRFFIALDHTEEQIRYAVQHTAEEFARIKAHQPGNVAVLEERFV